MADQTLASGGTLTDATTPKFSRRIRSAVHEGTTLLPPFLRPGLIRESIYMASTMKNWPAWVKGLYFRGGAPRVAEFRNGVRLESLERDSLFFLVVEIMADRCYTPRWFYNPGPADIVIDIGANIGVFAAHICSLSRSARVTCFEPDPYSYKTLANNVSTGDLPHRVQTHHAAVWREGGTVYLALSQECRSIVQKVVAHADGAGNKVKCFSLRQVLDMADPTGGSIALLKMDAEGAETDILETAGTTVMQRIQRIAFEFHSAEKRKLCGELLRDYGFTVRWQKDDDGTGICLAFRPADGAECEGMTG